MGSSKTLPFSHYMNYILIFLAIGVPFLNFFLWSKDSHALPNTVGIYGMRAVTEFHKKLLVSGNKNSGQHTPDDLFKTVFTGTNIKVTDTAKYAFQGMTEMQVAKYTLGCYGDFDFAATVTGTSASGDWGHASTTDSERTALLNVAQGDVDDKASLSVCNCIDNLYFDSRLTGSSNTIANSVTKYISASTPAVPADVADVFLHKTLMTQGLYFANAYDVKEDTLITDAKQYHIDITRTCIETAMPMMTTAYEDTVPVPLFNLVGQILLVIAALQIYDSFCTYSEKIFSQDLEYRQMMENKISGKESRRNERGEIEETAGMLVKRQSYMRWLKVGILLITTFVFLYLSISTYNVFSDGDSKFSTWREDGYKLNNIKVLNLFAWVTVIVVVLVSLSFEYFMRQAHWQLHNNTEEARKANAMNGVTAKSAVMSWSFHKHGNIGVILKHIACDVPVIGGFAIFGIGILAQSNITAIHSIMGGTLLLVTLGFLQHISNVIKDLYDRICSRLDSQVITELTLYNDEQAKDSMEYQGFHDRKYDLNENARSLLQKSGSPTDRTVLEIVIRPVLQFFGWSRLYIFVTLILGSAAWLFIAKDTPYAYTLHNMLDGQYLYFIIAFFLINCGFDFLFELLPFMFESSNSHWLRFYLITSYVIFFNVNQILYFWRLQDP